MPKALKVKPNGPPTQDPYTQLILALIVVLLKRYRGASRSVRPSTLETHGTLR